MILIIDRQLHVHTQVGVGGRGKDERQRECAKGKAQGLGAPLHYLLPDSSAGGGGMGGDGTAVVEGPVPWVPWSAWVLTHCSEGGNHHPGGNTPSKHHNRIATTRESRGAHRAQGTHTSQVLADKALLHLPSPTWAPFVSFCPSGTSRCLRTGSLDERNVKARNTPQLVNYNPYPSVNQPMPSRFRDCTLSL